MHRRYAFRDYDILVSARPARGETGWRPEICVIAPDDRWQFVAQSPTRVSKDVADCLESGRRCAENAICDLHIEQELAAYTGPWH